MPAKTRTPKTPPLSPPPVPVIEGRHNERDMRMAQQGYITFARAARLSGQNWTTINANKKKMETLRIQRDWYVTLASFRAWLGEDACKALGIPVTLTEPNW